jgi:hypothetical protein
LLACEVCERKQDLFFLVLCSFLRHPKQSF